jgi:Caspase recruitment domain
LLDLLDTDDDLLGELLKRSCLTLDQLSYIENTNDLRERNKKLLGLFLRNSNSRFNLFKDALGATQPHLVPLLTTGDDLLGELLKRGYLILEQQSIIGNTCDLLEQNRKLVVLLVRNSDSRFCQLKVTYGTTPPHVVPLLITDDELLGELLNRNCLTQEQLSNIENTTDLLERNRNLLGLLSRNGDNCFSQFKDALGIIYPHLAPLLNGSKGKT